MKRLVVIGVVALLFATMGFGEARDGMWPGSAVLFPYWDSLNGFTTHFRITNIAAVTPNFFAGGETLGLHLWYMNKICQEQNFIIDFTPNDTNWIRVWQQADYDRVWDPFLGTFVGSNQGFAIGFAITQSNDFGNWIIPWNFFTADAIVQNVGLGWAFAYEALSAEADPFVVGPLDTDPPTLFSVIPNSFNFFPFSGHYLGLCTPQFFFPHYITSTMSGWRFYDTNYVILPWDGLFEASTQYQNCYFFNSITYDAEEVPISNSSTLVRCWALCDIDQITQRAARRSADGFGWTRWIPNPTAVDFPFNNRICNTTVPALNSPCFVPVFPLIRPFFGMGAFVLQFEPQRITSANHIGWGFYSPRNPNPLTPSLGRLFCSW